MKIEFRRYEDSLATAWDDFIENDSLNGTFLHTRKFYNHNRSNKTDDHSFVFYKKNKIVGVVPFNYLDVNKQKVFHSYLRATYGGFVISRECGVEEVLEMVGLIVSEAKRLDVQEIIIRNPFRIFNEDFCDESDYAMWYFGFGIKYRELEIAIQLGKFDAIEKRYSDATKRSINKGKKIISVEQSGDFEKYWSILEKNLLEKHGAKPTHNFEDFTSLLNNIGTNRIRLFVAKLDEKIIAGILVFLANDRVIHAQYIASDNSFQEYRPLNVIIDHIIEFGCRENYRFFNLGTANEDGGRKINEGLFRFKEGFGGRGVLRETMHLKLNNTNIG